MKRWFVENKGNSIATEKAMSKLELLILSSQISVKDYITSFSDIMERLEIAQLVLARAHQIRLFIKGIIDPSYQLLVNKVRDMLIDGSVVTIQYYYNCLRSDDNWIID